MALTRFRCQTPTLIDGRPREPSLDGQAPNAGYCNLPADERRTALEALGLLNEGGNRQAS